VAAGMAVRKSSREAYISKTLSRNRCVPVKLYRFLRGIDLSDSNASRILTPNKEKPQSQDMNHASRCSYINGVR